jgi:hypothetical protein
MKEMETEMGSMGRTSDSCSVPFSRICLMTCSSACVPNSLSRVPFEAPSKVPCAPCLINRISTLVVQQDSPNVSSRKDVINS